METLCIGHLVKYLIENQIEDRINKQTEQQEIKGKDYK